MRWVLVVCGLVLAGVRGLEAAEPASLVGAAAPAWEGVHWVANAPARGLATLALQAANTYTSQTTVMVGTLQFNNAGTLAASASPVTVNQGATLLIDNTGTANVVNRLSGNAVTLNGGFLTFQGTSAGGTPNVASTETLGTLTLNTGHHHHVRQRRRRRRYLLRNGCPEQWQPRPQRGGNRQLRRRRQHRRQQSRPGQ